MARRLKVVGPRWAKETYEDVEQKSGALYNAKNFTQWKN